MRRARIGIIGAGFWAASFYLPFLAQQSDVEIIGVVRRNEEALAGFRRAYDFEVVSSCIDDLLDARCDGVIVASPHSRHSEHAIAALEAGCHVLIEKPMTVSYRDAIAVRDAARLARRTLTLAYGWNYTRMMTWAEETVRSGALGRTTSVTGYMASSLTDLFAGRSGYGAIDVGGYVVEAQPETWAQANQGGGYLYGQLSHLLGAALLLIPHAPLSVAARMNLLPNDSDLDVSLTVQFADDVIGTFSGHGRLPWGQRHSMDVRVAGEHGVISVDMERERAEILLSDDTKSIGVIRRSLAPAPETGEGRYALEGGTRRFVDVCLGRDVPEHSSADLGVRTVAIMEAAARSARLDGFQVHVRDVL
ncbi:MAG: Gfo/Idh/MocA family oxidoreductase [Actinobacteria bacterium]|nr:Gfo/Idh/MocA family oxidoreductase [Actinomycetota bacterium]